MTTKKSPQHRKQRELARKRFAKHRRINESADPGPRDSILVLDHLKPDFNIGKIFRSADAFGVSEVHLVGIDYFDPAPAKGSFKWVPARFFGTISECFENLQARDYQIIALDPEAESSVQEFPFPVKSAFVFGHEEFGLSFSPADYPDIRTLRIQQVGQVQSLNVSIAASILLYEYSCQHQAAPGASALVGEGS